MTRDGCFAGVMLMFLFPYIATTAGWNTAEVGWQPWLIYGLMRTTDGPCPRFCFYF